MNMRVSRILHAGYVFEALGTRIVFDPIFENPFSRNCHAFPSASFDLEQIKALEIDAVFISHYHDDHFSLESLDLLDRSTPIYFYCLYEPLLELIQGLGFLNVHALQLNAIVKVGSFEVTPLKALDWDVDSIFHIRAEGLNVLNVVDSWIDLETLDQLKGLAPWDLVLWPFQTMRELAIIAPSRFPSTPEGIPIEWMEQLELLNPKAIVPSSCQFRHETWSWYNHALFPISYRQFEQEVRAKLTHTEIVRMNPSVSIWLDSNGIKPAPPLPWVLPIGDQNVDYDYQEDLKPPSTAEVARHFEALDPAQVDRVSAFCRGEIIEKYRGLDRTEEEFFRRERIWQLSLYDHDGQQTNFRYKVSPANLMLVEERDEPLAWLTEVPISKLYAALEAGESLTSMYVRINDCEFAPEIEAEINDVDILGDPLIRCLFAGSLGSYQKAQLNKLKASVRGKQS